MRPEGRPLGARLQRFVFAVSVAALPALGAPGGAGAQVFLAAEPLPPFAIGPLFMFASVTPDLSSVTVRVSWSLTPVPRAPADALRQDLYLLWPAELAGPTAPGPGDLTLRQFVEERGFDVVSEGRLMIRARDRAKLGTGAEGDPTDTVASYVTFYKQGTNPSQSGLGTFIKIPWSPLFRDPVTLISLTMSFKDLITPKPATWLGELFWGRRHILTLGAGTAGSVALYSMYLERREHVVPLARDFSLLIANFADADHLRIEEISPPAATRRPSRVRAGAENVTLALSGGEGSVPQTLKVQFSYFQGMIAWRPILISLLFLALGNVMGALMFTQEITRFVRRRLHVGRTDGRGRQRGTVPAPEMLERIVPGTTTRADVLALCGSPAEEHEFRASPVQSTLIYRGVRVRVHRRHRLGWVATVSHREEERQEVEIVLDGDRVRNVQTRVSRARLP